MTKIMFEGVDLSGYNLTGYYIPGYNSTNITDDGVSICELNPYQCYYLQGMYALYTLFNLLVLACAIFCLVLGFAERPSSVLICCFEYCFGPRRPQEDPENPLVLMASAYNPAPRNVDRRNTETQATAETTSVQVMPSTDKIKISILPAQTSDTNEDNKKKIETVCVAISSEKGAEVQAKISAEARKDKLGKARASRKIHSNAEPEIHVKISAKIGEDKHGKAKSVRKIHIKDQPEVNAKARVKFFTEKQRIARAKARAKYYTEVKSGAYSKAKAKVTVIPEATADTKAQRQTSVEKQNQHQSSSGHSLSGIFRAFEMITIPSFRSNDLPPYGDIHFIRNGETQPRP